MAKHEFPWRYWAYGCPLKSEVEVPVFLPVHRSLTPTTSSVLNEIQVRLAAPGAIVIPPDVAQKSIAVQSHGQTITLYVKDIVTFVVEQGAVIQCLAASGAQDTKLSLALSGIGLAALFFQRGCFIAHGSAIAIEGHAALFLGDSGAGKSSLAIALHQRGYPIVTDDLAVIYYRQGVPYLLPAFPEMRVTEETAEALGLDWSSLPGLPDLPKRRFRFENEFLSHAIPLRQIYVLKRSCDQDPTIYPLQGHQSMMELMHHAEVMGIFSQDKTHPFAACAQLAQRVPMYYFARSMDWYQLPQVLDYFQTHWLMTSNRALVPNPED